MQKITSYIKFMSLTSSILLVFLIATTIYLNQQTKHDARIANIAGKQRMLSQKIAKEVFLNLNRPTPSFEVFHASQKEFEQNLLFLKGEKQKDKVSFSLSDHVQTELNHITLVSEQFFTLSYHLINQLNNHQKPLQHEIDTFYHLNDILLQDIDKSVSDFTIESEQKRNFLEQIQYIGGLLTILSVIGSTIFIRRIEKGFDEFLSHSKDMSSIHCEEFQDEDVICENKNELVEAEANMKHFLTKIEKVLNKAHKALEESQTALEQIEPVTQIIETQLRKNEMTREDQKEMEHYLDRSEDLTINSLEEIVGTKKIIEKFQSMLGDIVKKMESTSTSK